MRHDDEQPTFEKIRRRDRRSALPAVSRFPTCSGKKSFSKTEAHKTIERMLKQGKARELRAYHCPTNPQHWHLTSMPRGLYRKHHEARH
jgi:hypothetical protein